jgi:hypothetical protein
MIEDWLFDDQRIHPTIYDVMVQGVKERTVSIRGGISWPQVGGPAYFVLLAQLERKDEDGNLRFLAFYEDQADTKTEFFRKIGVACNRWRVNALCHGGKLGAMGKGGPDEDLSFAVHLDSDLREREKRCEIIEMPCIAPSWRSGRDEFLVSLVRDHIVNKTLLLFQLSDNKTPLLFDRIRNSDTESNILEVPELKALAFVMDDFDASPWRPPDPPSKKYVSPWVL